MLKCKICGKEFEANLERHYVVRDKGKTGLATIVSNDEEKIYDVFDCPSCGCQVIAQERKRKLFEGNLFDEEHEEGCCNCNCKENIECVEEHDGCLDCKYVSFKPDEYPCVVCKHSHIFRSEEYERLSCKWEKEDE